MQVALVCAAIEPSYIILIIVEVVLISTAIELMILIVVEVVPVGTTISLIILIVV